MPDKKKVKSISSTEMKEKINKEVMEVNDKNYDNYSSKVDGMQLLTDYESGKDKSKNKLKYIGVFLLGMVATIALFSLLGIKSNTNRGVNNGFKKDPYIGIMMVNLEDEGAIEYFGLDGIETNLKKGVVVETVIESSSAYGKLRREDIIVELNGDAITNTRDLKFYLSKYYAGDKVSFVIERNGKTRNVSITLGSK